MHRFFLVLSAGRPTGQLPLESPRAFFTAIRLSCSARQVYSCSHVIATQAIHIFSATYEPVEALYFCFFLRKRAKVS